MAKKSVGGGVFGGRARDRMSNVLAGTGGTAPSTVRNANVLQSPRYGSPVTRMGTYANAPKDQSRVFSERTLGGMKQRDVDAAAARTAVYSDLKARLAAKSIAAAPKTSTPISAPQVAPASAVVRTTTTEKLSPVKAAAQRVMMDKNVMGPRKTAAGKNASFGFSSTKDMGARAAKALGGLAGGAMSGGAKSGANSPARAAQVRAMNKNATAGPRKTSDGKNASYGFGGGKKK